MSTSPSLFPLDLASDDFRDRVRGCWLGKNCGGTLGAPLEKPYSAAEPFDVWWYPRLEEGGIPNDDLELQLFWLKALEEVGPELKAAHLAHYWLNHIGYNPDEYGLSKTNLRLGLLPPVASAYNNWFKDCMGCPIRSEVWACVAPGAPRVAALYAYEDSIVDHAGGESIYGEFFNVAIESAAFVVRDRDTLIDIGLSYVPESSATFRALRAALDAHAAGVDWLEARRRIIAAAGHYNAQYSPPNIAFQLVGWLYGDDFGDAICKAVNCGYDTDCTGATLGSILGIIGGSRSLPEKWTAPLGERIATSESIGGVTHASTGPNPVPATLNELTERVIRQATRVLAWHGVTPGTATLADLYADDTVRALGKVNPLRVSFPAPGAGVTLGIDYRDTPAVLPGETKTVTSHLANAQPMALAVRCELAAAPGWTVSPAEGQSVEVPAHGEATLEWTVTAPDQRQLSLANTLYLHARATDRPAQAAVPVVFIGATKYRRSALEPAAGRSEELLHATVLPPETLRGSDPFTADARPGAWEEFYARDNALPLDGVFTEPGVLYVQAFFHSPVAREVGWIGTAANCPVRWWLNGQPGARCDRYADLRPNYDGSWQPDHPYGQAPILAGWNELLIKYVRTRPDAAPFGAHVVLCEGKWRNALTDVVRTRFPWE